MVERLKIAVAKARAMREQSAQQPEAGRAATVPRDDVAAVTKDVPKAVVADVTPDVTADVMSDMAAAPPSAEIWERLETVELDPARLERNRLFAHDKSNPNHAAFDLLRTRILRVFRKHGWTRLGITSPGKACGKTFVSANLALSLSRQTDYRTLLVDMDLRAPGLARVLGIAHPDPITWLLSGDVAAGDFLRLTGGNLALAVNSKPVRNPAETILSTTTAAALDAMLGKLAPDMVIYDLPPMLSSDDVLGFLPHLDCVLLVAGGGRTKPAEITECERLLADQTQLLGVILNQAEDTSSTPYGYGAS